MCDYSNLGSVVNYHLITRGLPKKNQIQLLLRKIWPILGDNLDCPTQQFTGRQRKWCLTQLTCHPFQPHPIPQSFTRKSMLHAAVKKQLEELWFLLMRSRAGPRSRFTKVILSPDSWFLDHKSMSLFKHRSGNVNDRVVSRCALCLIGGPVIFSQNITLAWRAHFIVFLLSNQSAEVVHI